MISIVLLVVFLVGMVAVGVWGMKKTATLGDFFLGGRTLGPWFSAFAFGTTYFSAVVFIGFAGKLGWGFGLNVLWIVLGNSLIGALAAWLVLGRRTRRMTQNLDAMTMPEFFAARYRDRWLKAFAAIIIFVFLIPYSASVFTGLGYLFEANFHISFDIALVVMIFITGLYLILGGYFAVTLTDFIQGIIMIAGATVMLVALTNPAGGLGGAVGEITARYAQHVPAAKVPPAWLLCCLVFMTSFGTWGLPQMTQKFYAIRDESVIPKAALVTTIFSLIITGVAYFCGALTHFYFERPIMADGKPAFDQLVPAMLTQQLPELLMAVILLLVLSASMSTLSSLVLVSASAIAIDLRGAAREPGRKPLALIRWLSGLFVVISFIIARYKFGIIVTLMSLSWGVVAGSFMAPYVYGLYWKRATRAGVWAGMLAGMATAIGLFFKLGPDLAPVAATAAMAVPFLVVPLVSWCTRPPEPAAIEQAFRGI